ncbi:alpha-tectorin-like [Anoplopoma fimbria]|uniref:alpha-tectorin-like n=1 Tax=Anoplopoma fimbria TaxID=229290 RepID=UPI0023ED964C|nr:alpha-tectorin-like [Anoplopoma fimbria]
MLHLLLYLAALSQLTGSTVHQSSGTKTSTTCTVTGPAVIDFSSQVGFVRDRCGYTLMSAPGLQLLAVFRERQREDVSFLDHVILRLDGPAVDIQLGQGGKVQMNSTTLSLSSSPQTVHGVELSKDVNGVSASVSLYNYTASIFFDGTTAQIHMKGQGPALQGLCVNSSSSLSEVKLSELSSSSCETQFSEPADGRINCPMMSARCNLLKEAPFTSCHSLVNPEPYVTACNDTLCRYPAKDTLKCQFLEAYAAACSLMGNVSMEDWRSKASCSPPQGFCQDVICRDHEFCGEDISSRPACLCRAHFASKYRVKGSLGDPTVCGQDSASVTLAGCLLNERGIDYTDLHLNDNTCGGQMDEETHMVTFSFKGDKPCGTVISASNKTITYKNTIKTNISSSSAQISRLDLVNIDFSCFYRQPDVKKLSFKIKGGKALQQIESGSWNYSLTMSMCSDMACETPFDYSDGVQTDQTIYMNLNTGGLDGSIITLVTESCYATNAETGGNLKYDLVMSGCGNPEDSSVKVVEDGNGGTTLAFKMFQFKDDSSGIFLSCKMKLCLKRDPTCQPECQKRRRRRRTLRPQYEDPNPAIVSISWS